jgi:hypothetical protein
MTEDILNAGAISIELGVPALMAIGYWRLPAQRPFFVAVLAAISPFLLLFSALSITHLHGKGGYDFAFSAMWVMCFIPYIAFLIVGVAVGLDRLRKAGP